MATRKVIVIGELMAIGEAEIQSFQTTLDGGIIASRDRCLLADHLQVASLSLVLFYISCLRVEPLIGYMVNNGCGCMPV